MSLAFSEKLSKVMKGKVTGVKQTADHIAKRMASKKEGGYQHSTETIRRISEANKKPNPKLSETIRANGGHAGENNPRYGSHTSDENKIKYMKLFGKPFVADGIEYSSIGDCSRKTGIPPGTISGRLRAGKYIYVPKESK